MIAVPALFAISSVTLFLLMIGGFVVARGDIDKKNFRHRFNRIQYDITLQEKEIDLDNDFILTKHKRIILFFLSIIKVDLVRAPDYPLPWWATVIAATLITRGIVAMVAAVTNNSIIFLWPLMLVFLCRFTFGMFHRRRASLLFQQFPDALGTIVRCVRVGIPVQESLRVVSRDMPEPTSQEFGRLADKVAIGVSLDTALHELAHRCKLAEYNFFATALSLQARTGGPLAQTLETLADVIRKRVAMRAHGYALASEARTSATILGILPIFAGLAIWLIQPSYINVLFDTAAGHKIFATALLLLVIGALVMRSIIQRSLS